jgi:tRNA (guanine37-N1)-methyltransferase
MVEIRALTIFPKIFDSFLACGNPARAHAGGFINLKAVDLRDFTTDRHRSTDDYPYGGGTGMIMKPEPVAAGIRSLREELPEAKVILATPQGRVLTQSVVEELAGLDQLIFVCGRYEGIDERIRAFVDDEITIGDYVLSGGEIAAMVIVDAMVRLIPGVLGADSHIAGESFYEGLLEFPQYTRPRVFEDMAVPDVLLEGHHLKIQQWRRKQALARTLDRRPDLLHNKSLDPEEIGLLDEIKAGRNI